MDPILKLKDLKPLAQGSARFVFEHPIDQDLIVKVIRPEVIEDRFGKNTKWYKKKRRLGKHITSAREIQEYLALRSTSENDAPFLQRIVGFARTDMGLGLVLEAVKSADGTLAPSLRKLIHSGKFDTNAQDALRIFFDQLLNCSVVVSDLNMSNIVYGSNKDGGHHFVLIDGIGNNSLLPFKTINKWINHHSKRGRFKRLKARIQRSRSRHQPETNDTQYGTPKN
jgi:hypothetical protein